MDGDSGDDKSFLEKLEESYYGVCDSLEEKGIGIYEWFVNPLENRGIPSFYVAILLLLLLLFGIASLFLGSPSQVGAYSLSITVTDESGAALEGAQIGLSGGEEFFQIGITTADGSFTFEGLNEGEYEIGVSKEGYDEASSVSFVPQESSVSISLTKTGGSEGPDFTGTPLQPYQSNSLNLLDFTSDPNGLRKLSLYIFVEDEEGDPLNAMATVYDANSQTIVAELQVEDGYAVLDGLESGMRVFANVYAAGYEPYSGSSNIVEISASHPNSINVVLPALDPANANASTCGANSSFATSVIRVINSSNENIQGARVNVFKGTASIPEPGSGQLTNSQGRVSITLGCAGNPDYKASASKEGFVTRDSASFKAGAQGQVVLLTESEIPEDERSDLTVLVKSSNVPVEGASVRVDSSSFVPKFAFTNDQGKALFQFLPRGASVSVVASKGLYSASGTGVLDSLNKEIVVNLAKLKSAVSLKAFNYNGHAFVQDAFFEVFQDSKKVAECKVVAPNDGCAVQLDLQSTSDKPYFVNVTAKDFVNVNDYQLPWISSQQMAFEIGMFAVADVTDIVVGEDGSTEAKQLKITKVIGGASTGEVATVLYPDREYEARFTIIGKNSDWLGFHFEVPGENAIITKVNFGAPAARSLGGTTGSCAPQQVAASNPSTSWVDFSYDGAPAGISQKSIIVRFKILPLSSGVLEDDLELKYRGFIKRGQQYYRAPPDSTLLFNADSPLASGCAAASYSKTAKISSLGSTSNDFGTVEVYFTQKGQETSRDNFTANYLANAQESELVFGPLVMHYVITIKKNLKDIPGDATLKFNAPGSFLGLRKASYPGPQDPSSGDRGLVTQEFSNLPLQFSIGLNHLKDYSDIGPGFSFDGDVELIPLNEGAGKQLTFGLQGGSESVIHAAFYNTDLQDTVANDYSIIALNFDQFGNTHARDSNPFGTFNVGDCTEANMPTTTQTTDNPCAKGYLEGSFTAFVKQQRDTNSFAFTTNADLPSSTSFQIPVISLNGVPLSPSAFTYSATEVKSIANLGALAAGTEIVGRAFLVPKVDGTYDVSFSFKTQSVDNLVSKQAIVSANAGGVDNPPGGDGESDPVNFLIGALEGSCGSYPVIRFNPTAKSGVLVQTSSDANLQSLATCDKIAMRSSTVMPGDALPLKVDAPAPLLVGIVEDDGSSSCFETCDFADGAVNEESCTQKFDRLANPGDYVLRFNPEAYPTCEFGVIGNSVTEASVKLKISASVASAEFSTVTVLVSTDQAFNAPSLFIGPIYSVRKSVEDSSVAFPQLWAVTSLKQIGPRTIDFYLATAAAPQTPQSPVKSVQFSQPATQVIALNPTDESFVVVAKEKGEIIFVQGADSQYGVSGTNEYAEQLLSQFDFTGSGEAAEFIASQEDAIKGSVGFDPEVITPILERAQSKALQSIYWRSELNAWCQQTTAAHHAADPSVPICVDSSGNFLTPPAEGCCKANAEDWVKKTVVFSKSKTERCEADKFCNNLGFKNESRNYDAAQDKCVVPIDPLKYSAGSASCADTFDPVNQAYCDLRCVVYSDNAADFDEDSDYWKGKSAAVVSYGDSYKDSFAGASSTCSANYAKGVSSMPATSLATCQSAGWSCPLALGDDSGTEKPLCVTPANSVDGLLSSSTDGIDAEDSDFAFAVFRDQGNSNPADDIWLCQGGKIFAVRDFCAFEQCSTYCAANPDNSLKPARCDASPLCDADGFKIDQNAVVEETPLNKGPLVEVDLKDDFIPDSPFSLFTAAYARGFVYTIPVNTLVTGLKADGNEAELLSIQEAVGMLSPLGITIPNACGSLGPYKNRGLLDLQLMLVRDSAGFHWSSSYSPFLLTDDRYLDTPCEVPPATGNTETCHMLYIDSRGADDACIKSVVQFVESTGVFQDDLNVEGILPASMEYVGRLGQFSGTDTFAITPTGYLVSLRKGEKRLQVFEWWNPDGTYGGSAKLTWPKKNWWGSIGTLLLVYVGATFLFPALPFAGSIGGLFGQIPLLGGLGGGGTALLGAALSSGDSLSGLDFEFGGDKGCQEITPDDTLGGSSWPAAQAKAKIFGCKGENWVLSK